MNLIQQISQNWSVYERNIELSLLFVIISVSLVAIYWPTKNKKILLLSFISFVFLFLLNFLGMMLINSIFKIDISEIFKLVPVISSILLISNLGILVGLYISKRNAKGFKMSTIRKPYFSDSIKQTVFLILLGFSTLFFLSPQTVAVVSISILSTVITVWITYGISRYLLK